MAAPVDPVARISEDRPSRGHAHDTPREPHGKALVAKTVAVRPSAKPATVPPPPEAAFAAQVLGQPGKKRGLKGGVEVLDNARSTYLSREYSGARDRRLRPGVCKATEI